MKLVPAVLCPLALLLVAVAAVLDVRAAPEAPADGSPGAFSVARARADLEMISAEPHPTGSAANDRVADSLVRRLDELGLDASVRERTAASSPPGSSHAVGWARNVVATLPGERPTGRILLVAHYDSVPTGPGAADNGMNVAALLEIARVLADGAPPRNDVTFLFTDSEEFRLLGAEAFLGEPEAEPERTVVLNLDARGVRGRSVMFETGGHSAGLVPALADRAPVTTSLAADVYALLPNATDFTAFLGAGFTGLNFAVIEEGAWYHTERDVPAHVDDATMRDVGEVVLAATGNLAAADLAELRDEGEAAYFTVFGRLVVHGSALVLPFALLAAAVAAAAVLWARPAVPLRELGRACLGVPLVVLAAAAAAWAGWQVVPALAPWLRGFPLGDPYGAEGARIGLAVAALAAGGVAGAWLRRRVPGIAVALAAALWMCALAVAAAVWLPGGGYLFTWPGLAAAVGAAAAARAPADSAWRPLALGLGGLPSALLLPPLAWLLAAALGLAAAAVPAALVALGVLACLPEAPRRPAAEPGRAVRATRAALPVGAALIAVAALLWVNRAPTADTPAQAGLMYALDAEEGGAYWVAEGGAPDPWIDLHTAGPAPELEHRFPDLYSETGVRAGPAPELAVPRPELRVLGERPGPEGGRLVRVRVSSVHGRALQLALYAGTGGGARLVEASAGGQRLTGGVNRPFTATEWDWGLLLSAPPTDGVEVELAVRGSEPLPLMLVAQSAGLPEAGLREPRPPHLMWGGPSSGLSYASRGFEV
ncbi:M28 family peptidase [Allonocardiopsis opalescens]|uniref:Peptidase M28-like protein n=1 Tax=Allonocardiopsis opalescens TaxID=1144618 RepID=A0A2T0PYM2_9ACTN|nr:M28 family peptidase [Allonocardiopsis opalescens]PRX96517.1 peptidase M28-like protein [Allonocardiopsis opalescens]